MLNDKIIKLSTEIISLNAKLKSNDNEKMRLEKQLDKVNIKLKELEQNKQINSSTNDNNVSTNNKDESSINHSSSDNNNISNNLNSSIEKELRRQVVYFFVYKFVYI